MHCFCKIKTNYEIEKKSINSCEVIVANKIDKQDLCRHLTSNVILLTVIKNKCMFE